MLSKGNHAEYQHEQSDGFAKADDGNVLRKALSCLSHGIRARCTVTNTGDRTGDQVVQLYYHFSGAHVIRPNKQLVGFARVTLAPGESKTVEFDLKAAQLGYYNEDMDFVVEPGPAELSLGTSSEDLCDTHTIRLAGDPVDLMGRRSYTCAVSVS